jgi:hypothetical protein
MVLPQPGKTKQNFYVTQNSKFWKMYTKKFIIKRYTDKKEKKIFLIYKKIQKGVVAKSYMTNGLLIYGFMYICSFPHILGSPSSYMTLQPIPSELPYKRGKSYFLF